MEDICTVGISTNLLEILPLSQIEKLGLMLKIQVGYCEFPVFSPFSNIFCTAFPGNQLKILLFSLNKPLTSFEVCIKDLKENPIPTVYTQNIPDISISSISFKVTLINHSKTFQFSEELKGTLNEIFELRSHFRHLYVKNETFLHKSEELGANLSFLNGTSAIDPGDFEYFKEMIIGLNEKLKILQCVEILLKEFEENHNALLISREKLLGQMDAKTRETLEIQGKQDGFLKHTSDEVNLISQRLTKQIAISRDIETLNTDLNSINLFNESNLNTLKSQSSNFEQQSLLIKSLQSQLADSEASRQSLKSSLNTLILSQQSLNSETSTNISLLMTENDSLKSSIESLQSQNFTLTNILVKLESDLTSKNSTIKILTSELTAFKQTEQKLLQSEALLKTHQDICLKTYDQVTANTTKFSEIVNMLNQEKLKLLQGSAQLQLNYSRLDSEHKTLSDRFKAEGLVYQDCRIRVLALGQLDVILKDSKNMTKTLLGVYSQYNKYKDTFIKDLNGFIKVYLETSRMLLNMNRVVEKIRGFNHEKDVEISVLHEILMEIQKKIPYYPVKDDEIDIAIAEYVNSLSSPLAVPFVREDSGIYLFGTKKVFVKIDNNKISSTVYLVRVGGGSILVDEFIQMYTENELIKIGEKKRSNSPGRASIASKIINFASNS